MSHTQSLTRSNSSPLKPGWAWRITVSEGGRLIPAGSCLAAELWIKPKTWAKPEAEQQNQQKCGVVLLQVVLTLNEVCQCMPCCCAGLVQPSWWVGRCQPEGNESIGCHSLVSSGVSCPCESQEGLCGTPVSEKHHHDCNSWRNEAWKLFAQTFYPIPFSVGL